MLRNVVHTDWFTILILTGLFLIAFSRFLYTKRFDDLMGIFKNSNYLKIYIKDQKFINLFDGLLFLNLIISLAIFLIVVSRGLFHAQEQQNLTLYYKLLVGIGSVILIKVLIDRLIGSLFDIDEVMNFYVFQKITFKNFLGIILLPINIILIYATTPSKTLIYIAISLLFIINFVGFAMSFGANLKAIKNNIFYFILYLCALEIAPYVILFKVI